MIKVINNNINNLDDYIIITPSNKELYYKGKFIDKNYDMYSIKNYLLSIYDGNLKLIDEKISYIIMYNSFIAIKDKLSYYNEINSYKFIKDLVKTYNKYYDYDLVRNKKINDLDIIFKEYEKNIKEKGYISLNMLYEYVISNFSFNGNYLFLDVENLDNNEIKLIKKMTLTSNVYLTLDNINNKCLSDKLNIIGIDYTENNNSFSNKVFNYKSLNDISDEVSFINNDISKKIKEGYSYSDILITSSNINDYHSYFDLYLEHPFNRKEENGILTNRFIKLLCDILEGDFSSLKFMEILKLGVFNIDERLIDKLDNYIYSWNLGDESFYKTFTFNPNGNKKSFSSKDVKDLNELNNIKDMIINPIKYLLENIINESKENILKNIYIYLKEEKIIDNLFLKDKIGVNNLIISLENINDYARSNITLSEIIGLLKNIYLITNKKQEYQNAIDIKDLKDSIYEDKKIVYIVGTTSINLPFTYKFNTLITSDDITNENLISILNDTKNMSYHLFSKALDNKIVFITYPKLSLDLRLEEKSVYLDNLNLNEESDNKIYSKNELLKRYSIMLSNDEIKKCSNDILNNINISNKHDLDYKIDKDISKKLYGRELSLSPSSIEVYSKCPFYYFCKYGLKLKVKEKYLFDNREVGTFIHYVLENIIKNSLSDIKLNNIQNYVYKYSLNYLKDNNKIINNTVNYIIKTLSKNVSNVIKNIVKELDITNFKPTYYEFRISNESIVKPLSIKLDESTLNVIGVVDRIDTYTYDGNYYYRIIDYKTGDKKFRLDDVLDGLNLQMIIYLLAIKESNISNSSIIPSAILYYPALLKEEKGSRSYDNEKKVKTLEDRLKMDGIVNKEVICEKEENYIKILSNKKLNEEKLFDDSNINLLFSSVKKTLLKIGNDIYSGNIKANPIGGRNDSCSYCEFKSICKFDEKIDRKRKPSNYKNKEVFSMLEGDSNA